MFSISEETRKKRKNTWLYISNIPMVAIISLKVFALTMSVSAGLIVWLSGNGSITRWAKLIPEWMQFIRIEGLEHITPEINLVVIASLFFAAVITTFALCMLYQIQKNSEERGYNKCQLKILASLDQEKEQTITYDNGEYELNLNYVILYKEYSDGCIIQSDSGKKVAILKLEDEETSSKEKTKNWSYTVVSYRNTENPKITKENFLQEFQKDFFGEGKNTRNDVTIYSLKPNPIVLSILSDVVFETRSKEEEVKSSPSKSL